MSDLTGKKVSIIGAARSGVAAALAVKKYGGKPFVSELAPANGNNCPAWVIEAAAKLRANQIEVEFGGHSDRVYDCDLLVTSPGVPSDAAVLIEARRRGIKIISELELGALFFRGKIVAITGSNGKTTTTSLVGEIFSRWDKRSVVAGNIGTPLTAVLDTLDPASYAILEVSSFQLEWIDRFRPHVAAVLNISADHLDRHGTMDAYVALKKRIFKNQEPSDIAVLNRDDQITKDWVLGSQVYWFGGNGDFAAGCFVDSGRLILVSDGRRQVLTKVSEIGIKGPHNLANAAAASAIASACGVPPEIIAQGLRSFKGVEHRLEHVGLIGGVSFINDSKATNVDAVYWALQSVSPPIVLIAGGRDKGGDFTRLHDLLARHVKAAVLIGEAADKIARCFSPIVPISRAGDLADAVRQAYELALPLGTVLLSPGCASFDMFDNYEHRGQVFKRAVKELMSEK